MLVLSLKVRTARYSKINLDIVLSCRKIQDNNRYNIYIQFSIQYEDCDVKNVKNLVMFCLENNLRFSNRNNLSK